MLLRLATILFSLFSFSLAAALPDHDVQRVSAEDSSYLDGLRQRVRDMLNDPHTMQMSDSPAPTLKPRTNNANCAIVCEYDDRTLSNYDVCTQEIPIQNSVTDVRGTYFTMINSHVIAGGDINISLSENNHNGLIMIWMENTLMQAGGNINININNQWISDDCELIVIMNNVTFITGDNGDTTLASSMFFTGNIS